MVQHLDMTGNLLSAAQMTSSLIDVFRNQLVSAIWLTMLGLLLPTHGNNLNKSYMVSAKERNPRRIITILKGFLCSGIPHRCAVLSGIETLSIPVRNIFLASKIRPWERFPWPLSMAMSMAIFISLSPSVQVMKISLII